ncbi:unnamed protein product [Cyprideis torosa]|uniref:Uncharacterized protein n=1 Tax=Cyprideis torosa TaxID=163714 RepID=A0A7R8W4W5_9CRUS|nr:unnamed protein product [Cyprideis torosa]CAG0879956.1 unnamed protein product [Cyprideis torosa]
MACLSASSFSNSLIPWRLQSRPTLLRNIRRAKHGGGKDLEGRCLAIRREEQSVWERRAPLSPNQVRRLVNEGVKVLVQPSNRRAYPMQEYANAGALIREDISEAPVIVGVKQVPTDSLIPRKTYCFFSHTIKGQPENMPMLDAILEKDIRLIDYEKMCDARGKRVVAFGKIAGITGMIDILHGLGLRLLALGHHSPFMHVAPAHNYRNSEMAKAAVRDAGYEISLGLLPKTIGPLTFVFTGSGNVSQGAQEVFRELPHEYIEAEHLQKVAEHGAHNKVYACSVSRHDHIERKEGGRFNSDEFEEFPERYYSSFSKKIAPFASVIVNGIYWAPQHPRLLTIPDAKTLLRPAYTPWLPCSPGSPNLPHRLLAICDISADPGGSIEFMNECTTIDNPFHLYDAEQHKSSDSFKGAGVLVCSIDNMPTQLPKEATDYFGNALMPYLPSILTSDATETFVEDKFTPEVSMAVIASNGELTPRFRYISDLRNEMRFRHKSAMIGSSPDSKRVLVLGAGYVSHPMVEYLTRSSNVNCIVASALKDEADAVASKYPNVEPVLLDVESKPDLCSKLIGGADVVVSLLPAHLHASVCEMCIGHKTNMVTASYCTPEIRKYDEAAKEAGIAVLNEIGFDPGIDHLLAMDCIDEVHENGGKILSFISWAGGLPAPENSDTPLRYKFSWSPRGVLLNALAGAKYKLNGEIKVVQPGHLMDQATQIGFLPGFALEGYPNRDSTIYSEAYGIPEARTVFRGSLRYRGYCEVMKALMDLGLLDTNPHPVLHPQGPDITWFIANV